MDPRRMIFQTIFIIVTLWHSSQANLGYFWQITDLHLDLNYSSSANRDKMCWRQNGVSYRPAEGRFGDYGCDSPYLLVESAIRAMKKVTEERIEFILWTGDSVSHATHSDEAFSDESVFTVIQNVTSLLSSEFSRSNIYPVLGSMDWYPRHMMAPGYKNFKPKLQRYGQIWAKWVPPESLETFTQGGFYAIVQKDKKLQLLILNTSLYYRKNTLIGPNEEDPAGQFEWLQKMLSRAKKNGDKVYIIGHTPPGKMERYISSRFGYNVYQDQFNKMYIKLVRDYFSVIAGQFFGHFHSDSFRVFYDKMDKLKGKFWDRKPLSYLFIAPAVSPRKSTIADEIGPNNPGVRLYQYNTTSGQMFDYTQYYLNLTAANQKNIADWKILYNLTQYYDLRNVSAASLSDLAFEFLKDYENNPFYKYYFANSVGYEDPKSCNNLCRRTHFCVITNIDYQDYERCIQTVFGAGAVQRNTADAVFMFLLVGLAVTVRWKSGT